MSTTRMSLVVSIEVPAMLADLAGSKRGMGAYIEALIRRDYANRRSHTPTVEQQLSEIRERLDRLEGEDD